MTRFVTIALMALMLASSLSLSACGRKGAPEAPPGSTYPGKYPS